MDFLFLYDFKILHCLINQQYYEYEETLTYYHDAHCNNVLWNMGTGWKHD